MGKVMFYHLTRSDPEAVVAMLVPKSLGQGWRVMIRSPDRAVLERLDLRLWVEPEDDFLPHGMAGGAADAAQPVLLGEGAAVNGASVVVLLPGAVVDAVEAAGLERLAVLFDGSDAAQVAGARLAWKAVAEAGLAAEYWAEDGGKWEKRRG